MKSLRSGSRNRCSPSHLSALDSCTYRLMKLGLVAVLLRWTPLRGGTYAWRNGRLP
jgi:hypothetical protein